MKQEFKTPMKLFAFVMALLMLLVSLPVSAVASAISTRFNEDTATNVNADSEIVKKDVIVLEEDETLRDENTKHFKLSDGTTKAVVYSQAVHYKDADGKWVDIDNALTLNGSEYSSSNKQSIKFANKSGSNGLVSIKDGDYKIDFTPLNTNKVSVVIENPQGNNSRKFEDMSVLNNLVSKAIYADIYDGIDIEYILVGNNIKENIVVKEKQDSYTFSFELELNKLSAELVNGAIIIFDYDSGEQVYEIPVPYMYDANNVYSNNVEYSLVQNNKWKYIFTVTADAEWINSDDRELPVTIDPAINVNKASIVEDTSIESMFPDDCAGSYTLVCAGGSMTTYWKTNQLPKIPQNTYILDASFSLTYHSSNRLAITYLSLYEVISDWDEETFNYSEYISGRQGQRSSNMIGYTDVSEIYKEVYTWDIIELVDKWYQNPNVNFGLAIGEENPTLNENKYRFYSSEGGNSSTRPTLTITYSQTKGIEAYWSYVSQNVGLAGAGSVSLSSGNLVFGKEILTTTENIFGFSPVLTYESSMAGKPYNYNYAQIANSIAFTPYGFKLNANETLIKKEAYGGQMCYIWSDSDGTEHNFFHSLDNDEENIWYDDSGLQLRIELDEINDICYMFDSGNNKRIFKNEGVSFGTEVLDTYYLSGVMDKNGNELRFYLENNNKPVTISLLPNGSSASINMLHIAYNSSGNIYSVWNKQSGQAVVLRYSDTSTGALNTTGGVYLREIIYLHCSNSIEQDDLYSFIGDFDNQATGITVDGIAKYEYDNNGYLICAQDILSEYKIEYTYTNGKVTEIKEYGNDNAQGQTLSISYNIGYTEVRTSGTDDIFNNSDDLINVYVFDYNGRVITSYSTNVNRSEIYGVSVGTYEDAEKAKNSIKSSYAMGSVSSNYLLNGSFENAENQLKHWQTFGNVTVQAKENNNQTETSAIRLNIDENSSISQITQNVYLQEGSYTLSATVKCEDVSKINFSMRNNTNGGMLNLNADQCKNEGYIVTHTFEITGHHTSGIDIILSATRKDDATSYIEIDNVVLSKNSTSTDFSYIENGSLDNIINQDGVVSTNPYGYWKMDIITDESTTSVSVDSNSKKYAYITQSNNVALGNSLKIKGNIEELNMVYQDIFLRNDYNSESSEEQSFIVSALGKSEYGTNSDISTFGIYIIAYYENEDDPESFYVGFNPDTEGWQYATGVFTISGSKKLIKLRVACAYTNNTGIAYFDNICITKDNLISTNDNEYYEDGKLKYTNANGVESFYYYNEAGDLIDIFSKNQRVSYEYTNHILTSQSNYIFLTDLSSKDYEQILNAKTFSRLQSVTKYEYDQYGLLVKTEVIKMKYRSGEYIESEKLITENTYYLGSNCKIFGALKTSKDSLGQTTRYIRNENNGRLLAVIDPNNYGLGYTYDDLDRLISVQPVYFDGTSYMNTSSETNVEYVYNDKNQLQGITSNGTTYTFSYDVFGNQNAIFIGENQIISQTNNSNNGKVNKIEYASGTSVLYEYDELERVSKITYQNGEQEKIYTYEYDANGNLSRVYDKSSYIEICYQYDSTGKLLGFIEKDRGNSNISIYTNYAYDAQHRLTRAYYNTSYRQGESTTDYTDLYSRYRYTYDNKGNYKTNSIDFLDEIGNYMLCYTYDELSRLTKKDTMIIDTSNVNGSQIVGNIVNNIVELSYLTNETNTSLLISQYASSIELNDASVSQTIYKYEYDALGNIVTVKNSLDEVILSYEYDILGQLTRENNSYTGKTYTYSYDANGNILSASEYAYTLEAQIASEPTSTSTYTYGNASWKDQLTEYNGQQITYDEIGNPLSYLGYTFNWENVRNLTSITGNGLTATYTYNSDGIRTGKTVNGTEHKYMLEGTKIVFEFYADTVLVYFYDETGTPIGMAYRNADTVDENATHANQFDLYLFTKNLQGDIVGIYDENATLVASYVYDAWGNHTVTNYTSENIGNINPFRYRGYYFDSETGFYYLNTRYYNPQLKRFINADSLNYLGANGDMQSFNLYAYCSNNPILHVDPNGTWTYSRSFGISAVCIGGFSYSLSFSFDSHGNFGIQTSRANVVDEGAHIGGLAIGASVMNTVTKMDTIYDLDGYGTLSVGGSVPVYGPLAVSGDALISLEDDGLVGGSLGASVGVGVDVHATASITKTHCSFNIVDVWNSFVSWLGV